MHIKKEFKLGIISEKSLVGIYIMNKEGIITHINQAILNIFGYDAAEELLGKPALSLIYSDDRNVAEGHFKERLNNKNKTSHYECRGIRKDGNIIFIEILGSSFMQDGEQLIFANILDRTEQKKSELSLKKETERYYTLVESTEHLIWSVDPNDYGLATFNTALTKYFEKRGITLEIGMTPKELVPENLVKFWFDLYTKAIETGPFKIEYDAVDDSRILRLSFAPLIVAGEIKGVSVFGQDITEIIKYEKALRIEKEQFRELIESTTHMIWSVEPVDYGLKAFNTAFIKFYKEVRNIDVKPGMTPKELLPEDMISSWYKLYNKVIQEGKISTEYKTLDGKYLLINLAPFSQNNVISGISVFAEDVTNQRMYKEQLENSNEKLTKMLDQSIKAISKMGELRDAYTAGHQKRVKELASAIAVEMDLSQDIINNICWAAMIHDIGKIYIASELLSKPGKLTNLEYQILQTHASYGYEIASEIDFPKEIKIMIYQHHERLDGTGYPNGNSGDEIILESRILAVADAVEAMSSHRPYRPALGIDAALDEIKRNSGSKYDSAVVDACIALFREKNFKFST